MTQQKLAEIGNKPRMLGLGGNVNYLILTYSLWITQSGTPKYLRISQAFGFEQARFHPVSHIQSLPARSIYYEHLPCPTSLEHLLYR